MTWQGGVEYCRWLTRLSRSNFDLGLRLLPPRRRRGMQVVYAFCRAVDDLVDNVEEGSKVPGRPDPFVRRELELWRRELAACRGGFPTHPIAVALQSVVEEFKIPMEHLEAIVDGVEMDLARRRYNTFEELRVYCERVASAVGLVSIRVFGCRHPASAQYAVALGVALQLTNILRDIPQDARRGRVYLPQEEMRRFGYSEEEILKYRYTEPFRKLMAYQIQRAWSFYEEAKAALLESGEARFLFPARIMGGVYARLLEGIEQRRYDVFSYRVRVPRHRQILTAARCLLSSSPLAG